MYVKKNTVYRVTVACQGKQFQFNLRRGTAKLLQPTPNNMLVTRHKHQLRQFRQLDVKQRWFFTLKLRLARKQSKKMHISLIIDNKYSLSLEIINFLMDTSIETLLPVATNLKL